MNYIAVVDISSFIWCEQDFETNKASYYDLVIKLSELYEILVSNKSHILLKEELYNQIIQEFPYNKIPKGFSDFEGLTLQFLSDIASRVVTYPATDNEKIVSQPNILKDHFSELTNKEVRYLITRVHEDQQPKSVFFTFEYLWKAGGNLSTTNTVTTFEYDTICSDSKESVIEYFDQYKIKFEHNSKHNKYKAGSYESPLSCYNDRLKDNTKAQKLLETAVLEGGSYYNYDKENKVWVLFREHEENKWHGFDVVNREKIPAEIRKIFSK